jgi:hypothetical protein
MVVSKKQNMTQFLLVQIRHTRESVTYNPNNKKANGDIIKDQMSKENFFPDPMQMMYPSGQTGVEQRI